MIMKGNEKNNETLIALTPILLVEDKRYEVVSSGWSFISAVLGTISGIPIGGNVSLERFLLPILLVVMIIVMVVIVAVILVVVIVAIVEVVIVVTIIEVAVVVTIIVVIGVFDIIKLSTRTILIGQEPFQFSPGDLVGLLYSNRFVIGILPGQGILVFSMLTACAYRAAKTLSATSFLMSSRFMAGASDIDVLLEDGHGDNGMKDPIGGLVSLGSSGSGSPPKGRVDLTSDEDPVVENGDTRVGDLEVSVSLGERDSEAKRSLVKSSKKLEEVSPGEAGNSPVKPGYSQESV
nr:hypothetical protein [Tanacetum cinerariifolium]